jgi:hypothetical protein
MQTVKAPSAGLKGEGQVRVITDTQVGVTLTDGEGKVHQRTLEYPQGVSLVKISNWQLQDVDDVFIQLTSDESDILYIRPRNGTFYIEFSRFGAEPGELPTIRYDKPVDWKGDPWLPERYKAFPLYEAFASPKPEYNGMDILDTLTYQFQWDENLQDWAIVESTRKKWREHFDAILNVFGFDRQHDTFVYEGETYDADGPADITNVLPELEEILQQRGKIGQVTVEDGWVQEGTLIPGPFGMTRELLESAVAAQLEAQTA